jgi:hypothetical protein
MNYKRISSPLRGGDQSEGEIKFTGEIYPKSSSTCKFVNRAPSPAKKSMARSRAFMALHNGAFTFVLIEVEGRLRNR